MSIIVHRQDCIVRSFKKPTRLVCIFYFSAVKYQFYIHFQNSLSISLRVCPLDPLLGLRPWTKLGDFRPPGYLPICVNPSPKVTERLTPLPHPFLGIEGLKRNLIQTVHGPPSVDISQ